MSDIRLITIIPAPSQVPTVQQPQLQGGAAQGIIASFPPGTVLNGYIVNRDPAGNPILRTETGDITFASRFFLKIGSEVSIRIDTRGGNTNARILSVNGQPPEIAETQSAFAGEPEVIIGAPATSGKPPPGDNSVSRPAVSDAPASNSTIVIKGEVVTAAPPGKDYASLPAGSQLTLRIVSIAAAPSAETSDTAAVYPTPAAPSPAGARNAENTPTANPASYAAYARSPAAAATAENPPSFAPPALPGQNYKPTVTETLLLADTNKAQPAIAPRATVENTAAFQKPVIGQTVSAVVLGNESTGEAIVQSPYGIVRLQPGTRLPVGSGITFELTALAALNPAIATVALPTAITELATHWPSLQSIFSLLTGYNGSASSPIPLPLLLADTGPQPHPAFPQALGAGLMVFVSALKGGDFRNWLGKQAAEWLRQNGHDELVKRAEGEFIALARPFAESTPHQWQSLFFPFAVAGELQQARLFTKRDRKKDGGKNSAKGEDTRFVVEVDLSQMGALQMDGFIRKQEKNVEFDLFIRSHHALPPEAQQEIQAIYHKTGERTGYVGSLVFQAMRDFPVNPMEEVIAEHIRNVIA